jgi:hypothetical protein
MALSNLNKLSENIEGRILDGFLDLQGTTVDDEVLGINGSNDVLYVEYDKTGAIRTSEPLEVDTDDDGTINASVAITGVNYNASEDRTEISLGSALSQAPPSGSLVRYTGDAWQPLGNLQDVNITFSPVTQDADVANRQKQIAADVEVTLVLQQTTLREFQAMNGLVTPRGSGHDLKLVDRLVARADVGTADGYTFENVLPRFEGEFDGSGEGSNFTIMFGGRVLIGQLASFDGTLTFDV